eukprot:2423966-Rhodomonas_salina.1
MPPPALNAAVAPPRLNECHAYCLSTNSFSGLARSAKQALRPLRKQSSGMKHLPGVGGTKPTYRPSLKPVLQMRGSSIAMPHCRSRRKYRVNVAPISTPVTETQEIGASSP